MKFRIILTFLFFIFSSSAFTTNIRVLDFQRIIENNINLPILYDQIDKDQEIHKKKLKNEELNLQNQLAKIEELNLILEPTEMQKEIENYNQELNIFTDTVEKFNLHYDLQINNFKNIIINIILDELKKFSEDNNIDLILDSNNYILSNNSINITDLIQDQVNKKKIEINFEKY